MRGVLPTAETQALDPVTRRRIARRLVRVEASRSHGRLLAVAGLATAAVAAAGVVWLAMQLGGSHPPVARVPTATPAATPTPPAASPSASTKSSPSPLPSVAPQVGFGVLPAPPSQGSATGLGQLQLTYRPASGLTVPAGSGEVMRFRYPTIDLAPATQIASRFGFSGSPHTFASPPPTWRWTDGSRMLDIDSASGTIHYAEAPSNPKTWTPPPMTDADAIADASRWLAERGLLPHDADAGRVTAPATVTFSGDPARSGDPFAEVWVLLAAPDRAAQMEYRWPVATGSSAYPLIATADLAAALNRVGASQVTIQGVSDLPAGTVRGVATVTSLSLTTMTTGPEDRSLAYVIPALRFEGSVQLEDGTTHALSGLFPAVASEWLGR